MSNQPPRRTAGKTTASRNQPPRFPQAVVTISAIIAIAACFAFSYGNVYALGKHLGAPWWIAGPLPFAVDFTVVGLLVGLRHLSNHGLPGSKLRPARAMMLAASITMLILNIALNFIQKEWPAVAYDTVAPLLLLGWAEVGPWFLRQFQAVQNLPTPTATTVAAATAGAADPADPPPPPADDLRRSDPPQHRREPQQRTAAGGSSAPVTAAAVATLAAAGEISLDTRRKAIVEKVRGRTNGELVGVSDRTVEANALAALRALTAVPEPTPADPVEQSSDVAREPVGSGVTS